MAVNISPPNFILYYSLQGYIGEEQKHMSGKIFDELLILKAGMRQKMAVNISPTNFWSL